jgi:hypothetical protein
MLLEWNRKDGAAASHRMSIIVVCPGCLKSFKVSDKFAGRTGPCPNCKRTLKVPEKSEEVKVHTPEAFAGGGRSTTGKMVIEPVAFQPAKLEPVKAVLIVAAVLVVLALTWVGGRTGLFQSLLATAVGLLVVSPLLALAAYTILRNDELEPYRGQQLYLRSALCSLAYVALWGIFALLAAQGAISGDLWVWLFVVPPFVLAGGLFAMATLDLEFGDAVFHYGFYLVTTLILRWAAGMKWVWDISR